MSPQNMWFLKIYSIGIKLLYQRWNNDILPTYFLLSITPNTNMKQFSVSFKGYGNIHLFNDILFYMLNVKQKYCLIFCFIGILLTQTTTRKKNCKNEKNVFIKTKTVNNKNTNRKRVTKKQTQNVLYKN